MAKILSQTGIDTSQTVEAWHVTQSIDAFTGVEAYNITLSGSFTLQNGTQGANKVAISDANGQITFVDSASIISSQTGSFLVTASATSNIITFTKGNGTTFPVTINTGSGGTPAGSDTQIQYNNGGIFGASSIFRFNDNVNSLMYGLNVTASGIGSFAQGLGSTSFGNYSHAEGYQTRASGSYSHAEGYFTTASGYISHAEGRLTISSGDYSHAEGRDTIASGFASHAEGYLTLTSGVASHAEGRLTTASGDYSHAEGSSSLASGIGSHAEGAGTWASASFSHAGGINTTSYGPAQTVVGVFNVTQSYAFDDLFVVGNGLFTRSNAFRVDLGGTTYTSTGTVSSGADYAEYFESYDGTAIPKGTVVELTGSFIKPCEIADNAIGVISSTPTIVGNSDDGTSDEWVGKYEKDKWGIPIREEIESEFIPGENILVNAKKISPNYDPSIPYTPRSERPEWNIVGIMGQILILKNQPIPSRWIKMKDIDDEIALYFVR
jgi:hypothetical protein